MLGKYQVQLGTDQFVLGMSSSDYASDGALGTACANINPFSTPGIIRAMATPTDLSTNIAGNVIASAEDSQGTSSYVRTFVDDAGNYYTTNGATVTKTNTATTNAAKYVAGKTDMVAFSGTTYVSVEGDIDTWVTSTLTLTNSWWVGTKSQASLNSLVPHPMLVYQNNLYIADANKLNTVDSSGTVSLGVLTLNTNEIIYALGIDPGTGLMMISVQTITNISAQLSSKYIVYLYDGIAAKATRKILVDDLVTGFYNVEGIVYVAAGVIVGTWNGSGITFLRKLQNVALSNTDLAYKHHITSSRNLLHIVDGQSILTYGSVIPGKRGFFYTASNPSGAGHLSCVIPMGDYKIAIGYTTNKLAMFDYTSTSAGTATLTFNNIYFPRPVFLRGLRVITTGITTTAGIGKAQVVDERNNTKSSVAAANTFIVAAANTPKYVFDFSFPDFKLQGAQALFTLDTQAFGIVRVYLYYDVAE